MVPKPHQSLDRPQGERMNAMIAMSQEAQRLGCIKGESAKEWAKRDPKAAKQFAAWIDANKDAVIKQIAAVVQ